MERTLLVRGLLAGAAGGLIAFVFARIFAEPLIAQAIDYESARDAAQDALTVAAGGAAPHGEHEVFGRALQANLGTGAGMVVFGAAVGVLLAVVYVLCLGRVGGLRPRPLALLLAAAGCWSLYLVPFAKYPATPPAIGHEETIRARGELYLVVVAAAVVCTVLAVWLGRVLAPRLGAWGAVAVAFAAFWVVVGVLFAVLPSTGHLAANRAQFGDHATETPLPLRDADGRIVFPGFPADVLAQFRLCSVVAQVLLWGTIGVVFAPLADRTLRRLPGPAPAARAAVPTA